MENEQSVSVKNILVTVDLTFLKFPRHVRVKQSYLEVAYP